MEFDANKYGVFDANKSIIRDQNTSRVLIQINTKFWCQNDHIEDGHGSEFGL